MSDDLYDDEFDDEDLEPQGKRAIQELRKAEKRLKRENADLRKLQEESAGAVRRLAFLEAGIPAEKFGDPVVSDFMTAYAGDLTPAAIRQAAEVRRIVEPPAPAPEAGQHTAADAVSAGGITEGAIDRETEAINAIRNASSQEEVLRLYAQAGGNVKNPLDD